MVINGLFCVFAESANLPRNMIENSMFEEEPDVVDLAKDSAAFPVCHILFFCVLNRNFIYFMNHHHSWDNLLGWWCQSHIQK